MTELPHAHTSGPQTEHHTSTSKDSTRIPKPPRQVRRKPRPLLRGQLVRPEILSAGIGHRARQLGQRRAHTARNERDPKETIDDEHGTSGADTGDQRRRDTEPRIGHAEGDADEGQYGEIALQVLRVAHLGESKSVRIFRPRALLD